MWVDGSVSTPTNTVISIPAADAEKEAQPPPAHPSPHLQLQDAEANLR